MTTQIDPDRAVLQDKFTAIVDRFLATNPDWQPDDIPGQLRSRARFRKGHLQLDLELHMGKSGNGNITYSYTTPPITCPHPSETIKVDEIARESGREGA